MMSVQRSTFDLLSAGKVEQQAKTTISESGLVQNFWRMGFDHLSTSKQDKM
ncbi:hypothetical protein [Arthrobacter sp. ok362]|uniref:hypothetical protein n=1 Tax=Arthrobacter sp. ok362 TaxID=1761745 RepID=UPI001587FE74|nr:hypothetical protein [Arthrobacter sp. ok362]